MAAVTAISLAACSTEPQESAFDAPLPWNDSVSSYEKLDYTVAVYNTSKGEAESKRVKIGNGTLTFTLDEGATAGYTVLDMSFTVKYDSVDAAGKDAGLTDTITSRVVFEPKSLSAKSMQKSVVLADREGEKNLSYTVTADYFDTHKATLKYTKSDDKEKTRKLSRDACHDNEMMFFLARAQNIKASSSTMFKMVNIFDMFTYGKPEYTVGVTCGSERKTDLGEWVKDFGIQAVTDEKTQNTSYPIKSVLATIMINEEEHGPTYSVVYAKDSFKKDNKEHKKLPLKIDYSSYNGSKPYRSTSYTLSSCTFQRPAAE